eukprot:gene3088-2263_t
MDAFSAGFDITAAKFAFSNDWLVLGGTFGTNGCVQVRGNSFINGVDGIKRFEVKCNYLVEGFVNCLEICSIERLGKSVTIIGGKNPNDGCGFVEVVDMKIGAKTSLTSDPEFEFLRPLLSGIGGVTSVVFKADREVLILSTDLGEVIVVDFYQKKTLHRDVVDASGIVSIQLTAGGKLVTLGHSSLTPVKVWDFSFSDLNNVLKLIQELEVPVSSPLKASLSFREPLSKALSSSSKSVSFDDLSVRTDLQRTALQAQITCMTVHPSQERVFLGNANGGVILWDMRMKSTVAFQSHSSRVNAVVVHPYDSNTVISASTDGYIKQTNTRKMPTSAPINVFAATNHHHLLTESDVIPLFQQEFAMIGLDSHPSSQTLLVTAEFGQVFRFTVQ